MARTGPNQRRKTLAAALAAALMLPFATTVPAVADAHDDDVVPLPDIVTEVVASPSAADEAEVVVVHGIPDVEVDVLINGDAALTEVAYTDVAVVTATTTVDVEIVEPGTTEVIADLALEDVDLVDGNSYTVAAHLDADGNPTLSAFENETEDTGIEVFHLAEFVDVALVSDGEIVADDLANGLAVKLPVDGGDTVVDVGVAAAGETDPVITIGDVTVPEDSVVLVYAIGPDATEDVPEEPSEPEEPAEPELPFSDIGDNIHLAGILALFEAELVSGFEDGTFKPGQAIRRDQMATFLANALELEPSDDAPNFTDIAGNTHEANIRAIAEAGVTVGVGDGLYDPGSNVPRGQMATFLANGFGYTASEDAPTFGDIAGTTHEANIRAIAEAGITVGLEGGDFGPGQPVTRGQVSTFVARALGLIELAPGSGTDEVFDVAVADSPLGEHLVDGEGLTLYLFDNDESGVSNCTGDCLDNWPALTVADEPTWGDGVDGALLDTIEREDDGSTQVTYDGMPLYFYAGDTDPGDVNGQGLGDVWWVVAPDGSAITDAVDDADDDMDDNGGGYGD